MLSKVSFDPTNNSDPSNIDTFNPGPPKVKVTPPRSIIPGKTKMHDFDPISVKMAAFIDEMRR